MPPTARAANPYIKKTVKYATWVVGLWAPLQVALTFFEKLNITWLHTPPKLDLLDTVLLVCWFVGLFTFSFVVFLIICFAVFAGLVLIPCEKLCEAFDWDDRWVESRNKIATIAAAPFATACAIGACVGSFNDPVAMASLSRHSQGDPTALILLSTIGASVLLYGYVKAFLQVKLAIKENEKEKSL